MSRNLPCRQVGRGSHTVQTLKPSRISKEKWCGFSWRERQWGWQQGEADHLQQAKGWGCTRKQPCSPGAHILLKRHRINKSNTGFRILYRETGYWKQSKEDSQGYQQTPLESNREDGDGILLSVPAKCQALYQVPGKQHLAESSQLYEVGIVIPVSPRREELKETEGPDRLPNCKVHALTLEPAFKGMRNSK